MPTDRSMAVGERGEAGMLQSFHEDPSLEHSLAEERPELCRDVLALVIEDAGGVIPTAFARYDGGPGCTPFGDRGDYLSMLKRI